MWQLSYQRAFKKKTSKLVNFCVAILILKMEEKKATVWHIMLYYFKKGKNATETHKKICAVCGEGAVTDWTCLKWFAKFLAGDFLLDDAPWSGRPVEVDSDQIETLIETLYHTGDSRHTQIQLSQIKCWKSFAPAWLRESLWCLGST